MIYFIQNGTGPVKIGYTKNDVNQRLASLQSASPYQLHLLGTMDGSIADERRLHRKFALLHTSGEWFRADQMLLDYIYDATGNAALIEYDPATLDGSLDAELAHIEVGYIKGALKRTRYNITKAASLLGISFRSLRHRIAKHTISTKR